MHSRFNTNILFVDWLGRLRLLIDKLLLVLLLLTLHVLQVLFVVVAGYRLG